MVLISTHLAPGRAPGSFNIILSQRVKGVKVALPLAEELAVIAFPVDDQTDKIYLVKAH